MAEKNYVTKAGDVNAYTDIINKAQAYQTGGQYTPGQTYDVDYWGAGGGKSTMHGNDKTYKAQAWTSTDMAKAYELASLYDQQQAQNQIDQLTNQLMQFQNLASQYEQIYVAQQAQYAQQQAAIQKQTQATVDSINANKTGIENSYQEAQKQAYINNVLQGRQAADYLSAMGYTGGMAETTLGQIANNYENNRKAATTERDAALMEIDRLVAEAQVTGNADLANAASDYYNNYVNTLQNQAALNYQIAQDQQAQANADRQYELQAAQSALNHQQYQDSLAAATDESNRSQAAQDFDTFLNTYQKKYSNRSTYEQWIKNLQAMDDPYGYNKQKIAYLQQYINKNFGGTSGGSGGTGGGGGGAVSAAAKAIVNELSSRFPAGITAEARANAVMNAIEKGGFAGTADEDYILRSFGY
ncbi:MAG: hypothetical protein II354_05515 [Firmicutes bacterium]|nr:hypothetical protein [Bacillota bacterium]